MKNNGLSNFFGANETPLSGLKCGNTQQSEGTSAAAWGQEGQLQECHKLEWLLKTFSKVMGLLFTFLQQYLANVFSLMSMQVYICFPQIELH